MGTDVAHLHFEAFRGVRDVGYDPALEKLNQHVGLLALDLCRGPIWLGDSVARGVEPWFRETSGGLLAVGTNDGTARVEKVPDFVGDVVLGFCVEEAVLDRELISPGVGCDCARL